MHGLLVASQISLTLLLLTSAGAAINGFLQLVRTDLGYDPHNTMSVGIPVHQNTHATWEDRSTYFEQIRSRIAALPEVVQAGISTNATPPSNGFDAAFEIFGRPTGEQQQVRLNFVDSEYFSVLHIPLLQGRLWEHHEVARASRLALINQAAARRYWPHGDAVGKQMKLPELKNEPPFALGTPDNNGWIQIIGVVGDARDDGLRKPIKPAVFVPFTLEMRMYTQILVRTRSEPQSILNRVRVAVKAVDADQQVFGNVRNLEQWIQREDEYAYGRLVAALFSSFSLLALGLAAIGLYSVVSYSVAQRANEFGIRIALGARREQVLQLVFASTARSVLSGLACGILLSFLLSGFLSKWAEGSAHNVRLFIGVILLLILTAALAAFMPARRASTINPMDALRCE
jgi:predicted permease